MPTLRQDFNMATDYSNTGGTGDRNAIIAITSDVNIIGGSTKLIDGSTANSCYFSDQSIADKNITFDFGATVSKVIDEMRLRQSATSLQGVWKIQGSNDTSSWGDIGSTFTMGGSTLAVISAISSNTAGYRAYRLWGVSGSVTAAPWIYEFEFKIDDVSTSSTGTAVVSGLFFCHG